LPEDGQYWLKHVIKTANVSIASIVILVINIDVNGSVNIVEYYILVCLMEYEPLV
jgi:hypothetical protein